MFISKTKRNLLKKGLFISAFIPFFLPICHLSAAIDVQDALVRNNTQTILTNTNNVASILTGTMPGGQYDALRAQAQLPETKLLLRNVTNNVVNWVNTGFPGGNPAFVTNMGNQMQTTANLTINNFLTQDTSLNSACTAFQTPVKRAIGLSYPTFQQRVQCAYTDQAQMQAFTNGDFIGGGGWDAWLQVTTVQNQMTVNLQAQTELNRRIANNTEELKLDATWGNGFLSWRDCPNSGNTAMIYGNAQCTVKTPGSVIANKLQWADTSSMRELEFATDFNTVSFVLSQRANYSNLRSLSTAGLLGTTEPPRDQAAALNAARTNYLSYINSLPPPSGGGGGSYTAAIQAIDNQISLERSHFTVQSNTIFSLLDAAENTFLSSACNNSIITGVVNQITGTAEPKELPWNKLDVASTSNTIIATLGILQNARPLVANNLTSQQYNEIITSVNNIPNRSTSAIVASYSVDGSAFEAIKTWIQTKITEARNASCPINTGLLSEWGIN